MTKLFKIYLGLQNPETKIENCELEVIDHLKTILDFATIYHTDGIYKGGLETTLVIEIVNNDFNDFKIRNICTYLKNMYEQECVMFTEENIKMELV